MSCRRSITQSKSMIDQRGRGYICVQYFYQNKLLFGFQDCCNADTNRTTLSERRKNDDEYKVSQQIQIRLKYSGEYPKC